MQLLNVPHWRQREDADCLAACAAMALEYLAIPIIASVDTAELPYWQGSVRHALVVVGLDDYHIYANDPAYGEAPQAIPHRLFESAWLQRNYLYAVVSLTEV